MKINIPKLQSGGGMPPFNYYTPVVVADASAYAPVASSAAKSKSSDSDLDDKDILEMLSKVDGLPSDTQKLISIFQNLYSSPNLFGSSGGLDTSKLASAYLQGLQYTKIANFNKKQYDTIQKQVIEQGGLNEIAIIGSGVVVQDLDSQELKTIQVSDYLENTEQYRPISNAQLLKMRAYSNPFNNDMLEIVGNGIGMSQINKLIQDSVKSLGTSTYSSDGYSAKIAGEIKAGFNFLKSAAAAGANLEGMGIDGLYKSNILTKDQTQQAYKAVQYVYSMLPQNAKTLLMAKTGSQEASINLIGSLIASGASNETKFTTNLELDAEGRKPGSKKETEEGLDKLKTNVALQFVQGRGYTSDFNIMSGTSEAIRVKSHTLPIVSASGTPIGNNSTLNELSSSMYSGIFDMSQVSMGEMFINTDGHQKVLIEGQAHGVDMPIDVEEYMSTNRIKPDLDLLNRKELADQEIRKRGIKDTDYDAMNKVYQEAGLPIKYNSDGSINSQRWARFGAFNATAVSQAFEEDVNYSGSVREVKDDNRINNLIEILKTKNNGFTYDDSWFFGGDSFYDGVVFIPLKQNAFNALAGSGTTLTPQQSTQLEVLQKSSDKRNRYNNPGSFNL